MVRVDGGLGLREELDQDLREQPITMLGANEAPGRRLAHSEPQPATADDEGSDLSSPFPFLQDTELLATFSVEGDKLMIDAKLDK